MACSSNSTDGVAAAAEAASDMHLSTSASVSTHFPAASAAASQSSGTVAGHGTVQHAAAKCKPTDVIINKSRSYVSVLKQLCDELGLSQPTVEVTKKLEACVATVTVKFGYSSSQSHAKKADAQEDAARVALESLKAGADKSAKNCRAQLNEYCQRQQQSKPDYKPSGDRPFTYSVFVPIVHESRALPTEHDAVDDAALGILTKLGNVSHVLRMFDKFENFSVSCTADSVFTLRATYHFTRTGMRLEGNKSKKTAEKLAAKHALSLLYPDKDKDPPLDKCKNILQEMNPQTSPQYLTVCENDLYYSEVIVTFLEQMTASDDCSTLSAVNSLAERACKRTGLIS